MKLNALVSHIYVKLLDFLLQIYYYFSGDTMKRDFYEELVNWKNSNILTPLMVVGARQVGKTYIINQFCQDNFDDYIYINLLNNQRVKDIFSSNKNVEDKVKDFKLEIKREITVNTVLFIDEIQESEELIEALKFFQESDFPYKIITAGSLLGVKLKRFRKSFPVGKVLIAYMYPMSFKEFLIAIGKESFVSVIEECYLVNKPMDEIFHQELLSDYRNYLCTGGMPDAIKDYINNNGELSINLSNILRSIIDAYIADMNKYTNNVYETNKIERIYRNIPNQLAKENKKYQFSKLSKNARFRDYETAFEWLLSSRLIIPSYFVNHFETPLKAFIDDLNFKIYLSDVGLLTELLGIPYQKIVLNDEFMFKGALAENYVATELTKNHLNLFYYQKPQVMELDFLVDMQEGIIPIEVKANDNVKSTSLNKFMQQQSIKFGIRVSTKNFGFENNIKSVPLYAIFCMK